MASSGFAIDDFSGRTSFDLRVTISLSETDIANNRARWAWSLRIDNTSGSSSTWSGGSGSYSARVDGVLVGSGTTSPFDFRDGASFHAIASGVTGWITYGTSGAKTIAIQGAVSSSTIFGSAGAAGSVVANVIPHPAHTGLTIARVSDAQHTLSWTRNSSYSSAIVQRRTDDGAWEQVAAPAGNAYTFTDTTTVANRKYEYRVAGKAGNAQSVWSNTATAYTTPAAPAGVAAARSGSDIVVSAAGLPSYATSYDVRDGATVVGTSVSLPWTHVAPSAAVPHTYTVRAKNGSLTSAYSAASNTVQLISPPNAPASLSPNGAVRAGDEDVTFAWAHNPVDSSPQSAYEFRYRVPAGAWTTLTGTTAQQRTITLAVSAYEWQVRTKGAHPDFSPWSATATLTVIDRPGVAIVQPDSEWEASILPVEWTFTQAQSRPQSAWQLRLLDADDNQIESRSGAGATVEATLNSRLTEGEWTVEVRGATGDVWSEWAQAAFTVSFDPPAVPEVSAEWDEAEGGVTLSVAPGADEVAPATVSIEVERSVDGETWEHVADVVGAATIVDWESPSYGDIQYQVTALTAEGAASVATVTVEARSMALWLSGGNGFAVTARLPLNPDVQHTSGRERALKRYAGRSMPVAVTGEGTSRVVAVAGNVWDARDTATPERLRMLAQIDTDLFLFRDPDGRRIRGVIGEITLPRLLAAHEPGGWNGYWGYSFTLTEASR